VLQSKATLPSLPPPRFIQDLLCVKHSKGEAGEYAGVWGEFRCLVLGLQFHLGFGFCLARLVVRVRFGIMFRGWFTLGV